MTPSRSALTLNLALAAALLLAQGCAVGPDYRKPAVQPPAAFKEAAGWKAAAPADSAPRGAWWEAFKDPVLDGFEARVASSNLTLQVAAANYEQARQLVRAEVTSFLPVVSAGGSATRSRSGSKPAATSYSGSLQASWEPDFWGRTRRGTEADIANAQASAADLATTRLAVQAALAQDYIELRIVDEKRHLLENAVEDYRRTLEISKNKYSVGVVARSDVISAQAQLDSTRASVLSVGVLRAQLEHAIAVLLGMAPADLTIEPQPSTALAVPDIPVQVPSSLLERRPDIASAERAVAAANARVGVQTAGYFPNISLSADLGYQGSPLQHLFDAANRFWSLGAAASETILDFGSRRAQLQQARAAYDGAVAGYRQSVLDAFAQVEDNLAALRILAEEAAIQDVAVTEAADAERISLNAYRAGTVDYTTVVNSQVNLLNDRETALGILQSRLTAGVALIQALGGGWSASDLPTFRELEARRAQPGPSVASPR